MKLVFILLSALFSTAVFAQSPACDEEDSSTYSMAVCQEIEYQKAHHDLGVEYQKLIVKMQQKSPAASAAEISDVVQAFQVEVADVEERCTLEVADMELGSGQARAKAECKTKALQKIRVHVQELNAKP